MNPNEIFTRNERTWSSPHPSWTLSTGPFLRSHRMIPTSWIRENQLFVGDSMQPSPSNLRWGLEVWICQKQWRCRMQFCCREKLHEKEQMESLRGNHQSRMFLAKNKLIQEANIWILTASPALAQRVTHNELLLWGIPPLFVYVITGSLTNPNARTSGLAVRVILPKSMARAVVTSLLIGR